MANNAFVIIEQGTVLSDPVNKQTSNNTTMLTLKTAVQTTKQKEGEKYPVSDIYDIMLFGKAAEALIGKIKAKTKIYARGELQMGDPWTDRDGNVHITPRISANKVNILSGGVWNNNNSNQNNTPANNNEDEMPF